LYAFAVIRGSASGFSQFARISRHRYSNERLIDVLSCRITANKANRFDIWMFTDSIDDGPGSIDDIQDARGKTCDREHNLRRLPATYNKLSDPTNVPARSQSSAKIMAAPGSRSDGLRTRVLPVTTANGIVHNGIILSRLIRAHTT
jgi:hypothetical protein